MGSTLIKTIVCTVANTVYETDILTELNRRGKYGSVISNSDNSGIVSFSVSTNTVGRRDDLGDSGYLPLLAGQSYCLDDMEIGKIKVKSTSASDIVYIEVH